MSMSAAILMAVLSFASGLIVASLIWRPLVKRLLTIADGYHANTKEMIEAMRAFERTR